MGIASAVFNGLLNEQVQWRAKRVRCNDGRGHCHRRRFYPKTPSCWSTAKKSAALQRSTQRPSRKRSRVTPEYQHFRVRVTPTAYGILYLRLAPLVRHHQATPPGTQDSIRVGGKPLPDRGFHPARNAELCSARERRRSAGRVSGSAATVCQVFWAYWHA